MSDLDNQLLSIAELTPAEAARVLGRSRQAVSKSIDEQSDYFSAGEVALILSDAKRRDVRQLDSLVALIDQHYRLGKAHAKPRDAHPERDPRDLILSYLHGHEQVIEAARSASSVCVLCNDNDAHLTPGAVFCRLARALTRQNLAELHFFVPSGSVAESLRQIADPNTELKMTVGQPLAVPYVLCRAADNSVRGFVVARFAIEEILQRDATALWWRARRRMAGTAIFDNRPLIS
ncbi:MAG TPA: hypothetical protein VFB45_04580 [Pseudolabrys sp.]|nr:hypothetical protein [Pseudolabrys sp.]